MCRPKPVGASQGIFQFFSGGPVKDLGQWLFLVSSHSFKCSVGHCSLLPVWREPDKFVRF